MVTVEKEMRELQEKEADILREIGMLYIGVSKFWKV